jgi:H+-translocating NAD(P) transhydrogenase subunit alpha
MSNGILEYLTVFVLAAFVGIEVVSKVPSILHTPLMSGSNAIHGVILVGSMLVLGSAHTGPEEVLGFLAVVLATLNVVGGFVVTDRMLEMFKGRAQPGSSPGGRVPSSSAASGNGSGSGASSDNNSDQGDGGDSSTTGGATP